MRPISPTWGLPLGECGQERKLKAAPMRVWSLLLLFCSCNHLPTYMLSLFILFVLRFSSGPSFPWARIGGTMVREKHRPTFSHRHDDGSLYWVRHWKPRYVMWRRRRWRPNRPNLPLFPARDQNTWFSKGCIPPFLLLSAAQCYPARSRVPSSKLLDIDQSGMGFPTTETVNFTNIIHFSNGGTATVASRYTYRKRVITKTQNIVLFRTFV